MAGATQPEEQLLGKTIAGCRIQSVLGAGGMGVVYRAHQERLDAPVALKVIRRAFSDNENLIARFEREARGIAKLRGKTNHVVQVYDFGRDATEGIYYISMELVEGEGVDQILKREGAVDPKAAAKIIKEAALGLDVARQLDLVHRDIKPENLLLTKDGVTKITDFGLAKSNAADVDISVSGQILGTPAYMSPQQARGEKVDHRTDIYSLGASLYALLTGARPYDSDTALGMAMKHVSDPVPDAIAAGFDVPADLNEVVMRCMAKNPDDRYQTGGELAASLEQFLWSRSTLVVPGSEHAGDNVDTVGPPADTFAGDILVVEDGPASPTEAAAAALNDSEPTLGADQASATIGAQNLTVHDTPAPPPAAKSAAPLLAGLVVLALLVAGGLYASGVFGGASGLQPVSPPAGPPPGAKRLELAEPDHPKAGAILTDHTAQVAGGLIDAPAGAWVRVNGTPIPVAGGRYSGMITLADGAQTLQFETGVGGNDARHSQQVAVVVDTEAPVIRVTSPAATPLITAESSLTLAGTVTDAVAAPDAPTLRLGNAPVPLTDGTFAVTVALTPGEQTLELVARDAAGHETPHKLIVIHDGEAPALTLTAPPAGTTRVRSAVVTFEGTLTDALPATLTIRGEPVRVGADGAFRVEVDLADGVNAVEMVMSDAAGNRATRTVELVVELLPDGITAAPDGDGYVCTADGAAMRRVGDGDTRFFIDQFEVTVARYRRFLDSAGAGAAARIPMRWAAQNTADRPNHPVTGVSWEDAAAFAKWAGKTLPTEAQWAAAAGESAYPWGDATPAVGQAVFGREPGASSGPAGVGSARGDVSHWGVNDLGGNVAEWCDEGSGAQMQPIRGGSWAAETGDELQSAGRRTARLGDRQYTVGFRCVKAVK